MKNLLLIFVLASIVMVVAAHNYEWQLTVERLHAECQSDPNTKFNDEFMQGNREHALDIDQLAVHFRCMSTKMGWLKELDGTANEDEIRRFLAKYITDKDKLEEEIKECSYQPYVPMKQGITVWICASKYGQLGSY